MGPVTPSSVVCGFGGGSPGSSTAARHWSADSVRDFISARLNTASVRRERAHGAFHEGTDQAGARGSSLAFMFWFTGIIMFPLMLIDTTVSLSVFRGKVRPAADLY